MAVKVIGITTDAKKIAKILESEDYGFVCETEMGKYYAKFSENGGFEENYVRLTSEEQVRKLEKSVVEEIKDTAAQKMRQIITTMPVINMKRFKANLRDVQEQAKKSAEQMGESVMNNLKKIAFQQ